MGEKEMTPERRTLLFKLLRLAGSDSEPEALSAMRKIKLNQTDDPEGEHELESVCGDVRETRRSGV